MQFPQESTGSQKKLEKGGISRKCSQCSKFLPKTKSSAFVLQLPVYLQPVLQLRRRHNEYYASIHGIRGRMGRWADPARHSRPRPREDAASGRAGPLGVGGSQVSALAPRLRTGRDAASAPPNNMQRQPSPGAAKDEEEERARPGPTPTPTDRIQAAHHPSRFSLAKRQTPVASSGARVKAAQGGGGRTRGCHGGRQGTRPGLGWRAGSGGAL